MQINLESCALWILGGHSDRTFKIRDICGAHAVPSLPQLLSGIVVFAWCHTWFLWLLNPKAGKGSFPYKMSRSCEHFSCERLNSTTSLMVVFVKSPWLDKLLTSPATRSFLLTKPHMVAVPIAPLPLVVQCFPTLGPARTFPPASLHSSLLFSFSPHCFSPCHQLQWNLGSTDQSLKWDE